MRKLVLITFLLISAGILVSNILSSGSIENYLDDNFSPDFCAGTKYYWAMGLQFSGRYEPALGWFKKIYEKYPGIETGPLAFAAHIELLDELNRRQDVLASSALFLEKYPDHPKAAIIKRKAEIIKNGL